MILYNVKKEVPSIGKYKGKTVYYASPVPQDKITARQVEDRIINATALSRADVRAAITALAEVVREEMLSGRSVDLADLGSFKVVANGKRVETEKEVTANTLKTPKIQFYPKQEMRNQAKAVQRMVMRPDGSSTQSGGVTPPSGGDGEDGNTPLNPLG
ncbi:HU family DNA-binding protein [Bacteroides sp. KG123]|uniref:HU family DNA-binding protein n=1 Tax=unclassified Bacteroides TaxID=2646097 RepID=UPI003D7F86CD